MQRRAPGTPAASVGYRLDNTPTYFADVWGEAKPIPDQLRGNADAVLNLDRDVAEFLTQQALIRREKIFAANLFTTGKWNTDMTGVAAGPAGCGAATGPRGATRAHAASAAHRPAAPTRATRTRATTGAGRAVEFRAHTPGR